MNEAWRVLRWGGTLRLIVPKFGTTLSIADPTHKSFWVRKSFDYYCGAYLKKHQLDYGIRCCFLLDEYEEVAPTGDSSYLTELRATLKKDVEHYVSVGYPLGLES